ncbi:SDR family oxidoreductase [Microbulbifer magnicolonia]|uniref:SDR family oxidoreductase n=1 Tax=Microbulbifer magnicolonia TaxID=3109744 RepID=UPI002B404C56|nr:SDR family oxidoreductase [Microbulbifer sp. GG15]
MGKGYDITGKVALVTGANRGIGRQIVETFIDKGAAKVYAAVRAPASADALTQAYGDKVVPVHIDLVDTESIWEAAQSASDVQVVVNNAGVLKMSRPLDPQAIDSIKYEMKINVYGLIYMAQAFAGLLARNGGGAFVQLNSVASLKCFEDFSTYSASKAAAYSITQALRELLREQGTAVLSVHPGPIDTDMGEAAGTTEVAESPVLVAEGIVSALKAGDFHLFPDSFAKQIGAAYRDFAQQVVEAELMGGG